MRTRYLMVTATVVLSLSPSLLGQAAEAAKKAQSVQDPIAHLIPTDAFAVVRIGALDEVEGELKKLVARVDPDTAEMVDLNVLLRMLNLEIQVSRKYPVVAAFSLAEEKSAEPVITLILPTDDAKAAAEYLEGEAYDSPPVAMGNYIAFAPMGTYAPGAGENRLWGSIPKKDICASVDAAKLVSNFADEINEVFSEIDRELTREFEMGEVSESMQKLSREFVQEGRDLLDSADIIDLSLDTDGNALDLLMTLSVLKVSPMGDTGMFFGGDLRKVASTVPAEHPLAFLASVDMAYWMEYWIAHSKEVVQELPEDKQALIAESLEASKLLWKGADGSIAVSVGGGAKGLEITEGMGYRKGGKKSLTPVSQFPGFMDVLKATGLSYRGGDVVDDESGVSYADGEFKFDIASMLKDSSKGEWGEEIVGAVTEIVHGVLGSPEGRISLRSAATDQLMSVTMGQRLALHENLVARVSRGKIANETLAWAMKKAGQRPGLVISADLRKIMQDARKIAALLGEEAAMPPIADGPAAPLAMFAAADGLTARIGISTVGDGMGPFVKEMLKLMKFR